MKGGTVFTTGGLFTDGFRGRGHVSGRESHTKFIAFLSADSAKATAKKVTEIDLIMRYVRPYQNTADILSTLTREPVVVSLSHEDMSIG
jgi:hypothetical protein